jgi:endonuclease YncB( thermonuclease family)
MKATGWAVAVFACVLPSLAMADDIAACAGPVEIAGTVVSRIEQNGVLITSDGIAIHLEGIRLPSAKADRAPGTFTDQAYGMALGMTRGHSVTLTAVPPKQDRYDRVRAQVFAASTDGQVWVQKRLLELGLARVSIAPDRTECAAELYAAEDDAREAHKGLWSAAAYAVRSPDNVSGDAGTFQIVQGKVLDVTLSGGRAYLNFGTDWKNDFTATISPDDMKTFDDAGVDPRNYEGKTVRVRGLVEKLNGPDIEVANPQEVEVLP